MKCVCFTLCLWLMLVGSLPASALTLAENGNALVSVVPNDNATIPCEILSQLNPCAQWLLAES